MKKDIHPQYYPDAKVVCACGNTWTTGSTLPEIRTDMCSACHPFFTGEQRIVDTAGQVDRFEKRRKQSDLKKEEQVRRLTRKPKPDSVFEFVSEEAKAASQKVAPPAPEPAVSAETPAAVEATVEAAADAAAPDTGPAEIEPRPAKKPRKASPKARAVAKEKPSDKIEGGAATAVEKPKKERKPRKAEARTPAAQPAEPAAEASK